MKRLHILVFIFFLASLCLPAQQMAGGPSAPPDTQPANDTSEEIPQGVIHVRKPTIAPYVKVEYKYYLSHVNMVNVEVPANNGIDGAVEIDRVPIFDSAVYYKSKERYFPKKESELYSKLFIENMKSLYSSSDTPRVDTMVIGMWINDRGKVQWVSDDPEYTLTMPEQMAKELTRASRMFSGTRWGEAGGYYGRKKMFKKAPLILESYYCEMFVIVSSFPLTQEQKITRYSAFDYPLNSPALDDQQKASGERNAASPKR